MKLLARLLLDENLSPKLVQRLEDVFPHSAHVHDLGAGAADDRTVWKLARQDLIPFVVVTKDADFVDLVTTLGHPPKVVLVRLGNCTTSAVEALLRTEAEAIHALAGAVDQAILELG